MRRALNGDAKNGLLKHSSSYPILDENVLKDGPNKSPSSISQNPNSSDKLDLEDSMLMDEDYMYDTVSISKGERGVGKTIDVDKLKKTLISLKSKRDRQQVFASFKSLFCLILNKFSK